jgi:hypothetical protein
MDTKFDQNENIMDSKKQRPYFSTFFDLLMDNNFCNLMFFDAKKKFLQNAKLFYNF